MGVSNGVITAPVSVSDVCTALNIEYASSYSDVGYLCTRTSRINPFARFKPTSGGNVTTRKKKVDNTDELRCVIYGLAHYDTNGTFVVNTNVVGNALTVNNFNNTNLFNLKQQNIKYYRLHDFNGYDHTAKFNFDNNLYQCFPDVNTGGQIGFFYNTESLMLQWRTDKVTAYIGLNTTPLCYEDCSNNQKSYGRTLDIEDIVAMAASPNTYLQAYNFGDYIFGLAFKINNVIYLLTTGKSLNSIINSSTVYYITIDNDNRLALSNSSTVSPKVGSFGGGGSLFRFSLNLSKLNTVYGSTVFANGVSCSARAVLLRGGPSNIVQFVSLDDYTAYEIYAFSPDKMSDNTAFSLRKNFTIKKLQSYVNVTTKTNRTNNVGTTIRNAGRFLGPLDNFPDACEYEYKSGTNGWDWYQISSQGHPPWNYKVKCYLTFDSSGFYKATLNADNKTYTMSRASSQDTKFVRYKLHFEGFVCSEFRTRTTTNTNFINIENNENVKKSANLHLKITDDDFYRGMSLIQVNEGVARPLMYSSVNIGSPDYSEFGWSSTATDNVRYCTQQYKNETGNFSKCYSGLIYIDRLNYLEDQDGKKIAGTDYSGAYTQEDDIWVYVLTNIYHTPTGATHPDPKEFRMHIDYTFSPVDIFENGSLTHETETITVYDASNNTTIIEVQGSPSWPT